MDPVSFFSGQSLVALISKYMTCTDYLQTSPELCRLTRTCNDKISITYKQINIHSLYFQDFQKLAQTCIDLHKLTKLALTYMTLKSWQEHKNDLLQTLHYLHWFLQDLHRIAQTYTEMYILVKNFNYLQMTSVEETWKTVLT